MTNPSLPEWIQESVMNTGTHEDLKQALAIAWEALGLAVIESQGTSSHGIFVDALKRIEKLGEGE